MDIRYCDYRRQDGEVKRNPPWFRQCGICGGLESFLGLDGWPLTGVKTQRASLPEHPSIKKPRPAADSHDGAVANTEMRWECTI